MIKGTNSNVYVKSIAWKVSKYGVVSGPYFPVFSPNREKYGPEKTPYLDLINETKYSIVDQVKFAKESLYPCKFT